MTKLEGMGPQIVARYEAGESLFQIARDLRVRYAPVREAFEAAGGQLKPTDAWESRHSKRTGKLSPDDVQDIVEAYKGGEAIRGLAREYQVSRSTIRHHLEKQGVLRP